MNGEIVLRERDLVDLDGDGTVEPNSRLPDFMGISSLTLGPRDSQGKVTVYFTADIDTLGTPTSTDDTEAFLRLSVHLTAPNGAPSAICRNVAASAGPTCEADAVVDNGSSDPEDDPLTLQQSPAGPYPLGATNVTLTVTDIQGVADSCMGTVTVAAVDAPIVLDVAASELSWTPETCNLGYDLVRGDLDLLRASSGDFSLATAECLADDHPNTVFSYGVSPSAGSGSWFLVRRVITAGNGSYDVAAPSQQGSQDAEIAASGFDCP